MKNYKFGINVLGGMGDLTVPQHIELLKQIGWNGFFTGWDHANLEKWAQTGAKNGLLYTSITPPSATSIASGTAARTGKRRSPP